MTLKEKKCLIPTRTSRKRHHSEVKQKIMEPSGSPERKRSRFIEETASINTSKVTTKESKCLMPTRTLRKRHYSEVLQNTMELSKSPERKRTKYIEERTSINTNNSEVTAKEKKCQNPNKEKAELVTDETASCSQTGLDKSRKPFNILVGVTGSVAAMRLPLLVSELLQLPGVDVRVVTTEHAKHFYNPADVPVKIYSDSDEWELWTQRSDPVLHVELRRWADLFLIAPLDANTLAKIANGICDNLLTCVVRAWDMSRPLLFCPAMNTVMWKHPITAEHLCRLEAFGYREIPCISKKLLCGDDGKGAMAEVPTIVSVIKQYLLYQPKEPKNT